MRGKDEMIDEFIFLVHSSCFPLDSCLLTVDILSFVTWLSRCPPLNCGDRHPFLFELASHAPVT